MEHHHHWVLDRMGAGFCKGCSAVYEARVVKEHGSWAEHKVPASHGTVVQKNRARDENSAAIHSANTAIGASLR